MIKLKTSSVLMQSRSRCRILFARGSSESGCETSAPSISDCSLNLKSGLRWKVKYI